MADPRLQKLAAVLVEYSVGVRPGDKVVIDTSPLAEPLIKQVYAKVLQAGGHPITQVHIPGLDEVMLKQGSDDQLRHVPEPVRIVTETYDVRISLVADQNTKALSNVDPQRMVVMRQARTELMKTFMRRSAAKELRWTVALFPTHAHAQDADMSLDEYEDFVYGACLPDLDDPVGYWKRFSVWQQGIVDWLKGKERVEVTGPDTELSLSISGRDFENCDGHFNMPDGEVFTGPVEDSVEGHVHFTYPAIYGGREVTGVRLWFEKGKVIKASAEKNEEFLLRTLNTDEGARYVGEFAIGTNRGITRFTGEILFDEKMNGSFHMALGAGYPETGSKNESAIHWDVICDLRQGGEIRVDGRPFYRDGRFLIDLPQLQA